MSCQFFITGFPGYIASRLIRDLARKHPGSVFELLVHTSQEGRARASVQELCAAGIPENSMRIHVGDITKEGLGLMPAVLGGLGTRLTHVFHLAAVYDLAVPEAFARSVNVDGTANMNSVVKGCKQLERYVYFSTCYVSGNRVGKILESDLEKGQGFKNHYESTKHEAERMVRALMPSIPVTIIRPSIVVGDSKSGETAKYDGPYFMMRLLGRFRFLPLPYFGKPRVKLNLVPVDYVVEGTVYLAFAAAAAGKTYHLADPDPLWMVEIYELIYDAIRGGKPAWTLPVALVKASLSFRPLRAIMGVPRELIDYYECDALYDTSNAVADLGRAGIKCPSLVDYFPVLVEYFKKHGSDPDKIIRVK